MYEYTSQGLIIGVMVGIFSLVPLFFYWVKKEDGEDSGEKKAFIIALLTSIFFFSLTSKIHMEERGINTSETFISISDINSVDGYIGWQKKENGKVKFIISNDVIVIDNQPEKGLSYEKICNFSSHWSGLWDYGYDSRCKEYLYILKKK